MSHMQRVGALDVLLCLRAVLHAHQNSSMVSDTEACAATDSWHGAVGLGLGVLQLQQVVCQPAAGGRTSSYTRLFSGSFSTS
jgi:hypothetical protein